MNRTLLTIATAITTLLAGYHLAAQLAPTPTLPPFTDLPEVPVTPPTPYPPSPLAENNRINPGTPGRQLPTPDHRAGITFAILADRTTGYDWGLKYLRTAVDELNLLKPDLVFTVGDQIQGYTRNPAEYARQAAEFRAITDSLTMPWYPTAGNHDVISGFRNPNDRRFESLYQQYFGPLYYSVDYADAHFVILYSDEKLQSKPAISDAQIAWLQNDLNRYYASRRNHPGGGGNVFLFMHKPLWRYDDSNWNKVHDLLVAFNRRPVVQVERPGANAAFTPPRVQAVFAGHFHSYQQDTPRDGIKYTILGTTGGAINQDRLAGQLHHVMLVKVDATGPHLAMVELGNVHKEDFVTAADRAVLDKITRLPETALGIAGTLPQPVNQAVDGTLRLALENPLDVPLDIQIRMASKRFLTTPTAVDTANVNLDNYDSPWILASPYTAMHLRPGEKRAYLMNLSIPAQTGEVAPPQIEFVVKYTDSKGRSVPTVLKRRVPLVPSATVPVVPAITDQAWDDLALRAGTYAFTYSPYDTPGTPPQLALLADKDDLVLRVHVEDKHHSYTDDLREPHNLPSDAVTIALAPTPDTPAKDIRRLTILPFAPNGPQLLTNTGLAKDQTPLTPVPATANIRTTLTRTPETYTLTLRLPRTYVFPTPATQPTPATASAPAPTATATAAPAATPAATATTATTAATTAPAPATPTTRMNILITDNDDTYHSQFRTWAREDLGPPSWATLHLTPPPTPQSQPAATQPK